MVLFGKDSGVRWMTDARDLALPGLKRSDLSDESGVCTTGRPKGREAAIE